MKIAFLIQATTALNGPGEGVRDSAIHLAEAMERRGHSICRLDPWISNEPGQFDVLQFFLGGFGSYGVETLGKKRNKLCFAPVIDSNEPFWRYRLAAYAGQIWPVRVFTIPAVLRRQALASDLVVCRSTHERARITRGLGVAESKTEIVRLGVNPPPPCDPAAIRRRLELPDEFALHVSRYTDPRKNVARLIEAIGPLGLPLVIAGRVEECPELARLRSLCQRYPQVRLLGFLPRPDLQSLYAACRVFCLPSLHEGVGLVSLEAAACGAALVTTRNGGPPDYFGSLAEYVDPLDVSQIREAIRRVWRRPQGEALRDHVLSQLTWAQSAVALERAYERILPGE